ncbi:hypothetical protein PoB_001296200 [Plakobranchus ocellatus]|uniref:Uncharacterized protein n=1 Tax=Plakobranchus ocellatus TaxID=259542 RepID=A0AAV3YVV7_9GAST|nr:hypothetical protein PoB_001296200 [Plakobranchus ocellatus]
MAAPCGCLDLLDVACSLKLLSEVSGEISFNDVSDVDGKCDDEDNDDGGDDDGDDDDNENCKSDFSWRF